MKEERTDAVLISSQKSHPRKGALLHLGVLPFCAVLYSCFYLLADYSKGQDAEPDQSSGNAAWLGTTMISSMQQ